jgi:hypothetical protein
LEGGVDFYLETSKIAFLSVIRLFFSAMGVVLHRISRNKECADFEFS